MGNNQVTYDEPAPKKRQVEIISTPEEISVYDYVLSSSKKMSGLTNDGIRNFADKLSDQLTS